KQTKNVPVTILNRESLAPGGHYGAVLVTPTDVGGDSTKVQINQVASALLFVKKQGGELYNLSLSSAKLSRSLLQIPSKVDLRFQNAGNVHVTPRGTITITDPRGRQVQKGYINAESALVLPESFRQLSVPLMKLDRTWIPGRYTATVAYRFDGQDQVRETKMSFVYVNLGVVLSVLLVGAGLLLVFGNPRLRSRAKQSTKLVVAKLPKRRQKQ
ncbi:MAG TPA: hypothetical protein VK983_04235, partial [Candidatus Limnocylindrales bacterium]|nr:hypothetical protein [Candidatus Limnocylindrales bacterium]